MWSLSNKEPPRWRGAPSFTVCRSRPHPWMQCMYITLAEIPAHERVAQRACPARKRTAGDASAAAGGRARPQTDNIPGFSKRTAAIAGPSNRRRSRTEPAAIGADPPFYRCNINALNGCAFRALRPTKQSDGCARAPPADTVYSKPRNPGISLIARAASRRARSGTGRAVRLSPANSASSSAATDRTNASPPRGPTICRPNGMP